jgi:hypothetical protein
MITAHNKESPFDVDAAVAEIRGHLQAAEKAEKERAQHAQKAQNCLVEIAQKHPEHLEAVCKKLGIGDSRRKELMQIARREKTVEEVRTNTRNRVQKHRGKRKATTSKSTATAAVAAKPDPAVTSAVTAPAGNKVDPGATKAAQAPKAEPSKLALGNFEYACNTWLPQLSADDRAAALKHVQAVFERLNKHPEAAEDRAKEQAPATVH